MYSDVYLVLYLFMLSEDAVRVQIVNMLTQAARHKAEADYRQSVKCYQQAMELLIFSGGDGPSSERLITEYLETFLSNVGENAYHRR